MCLHTIFCRKAYGDNDEFVLHATWSDVLEKLEIAHLLYKFLAFYARFVAVSTKVRH
jgi:hypothetical protein